MNPLEENEAALVSLTHTLHNISLLNITSNTISVMRTMLGLIECELAEANKHTA